MILKVSENVSYFEAKRRFEKKSYAAVVNTSGDIEEDKGMRVSVQNKGKGIVNSENKGKGAVLKSNSKSNELDDNVLPDVSGHTRVSDKNIMGARSGSDDTEREKDQGEMVCEEVEGDLNIGGNSTQEEIKMIAFITNLTKIINRNPGKLTIQARQISNLLYKTMNKKIEVYDIIKALQ